MSATAAAAPPPPPPASAAAARPGLGARLAAAAKALKRDVLALYYATGDAEAGWPARAVAALAIAYAVSPVDLIPDFIPVLGLLDDLIILPALLYFAIKLLPPGALARGRARAGAEPLRLSDNWAAAAAFFLIWDASLCWAAWWAAPRLGGDAGARWRWAVAGGAAGAAAAAECVWALWTVRRRQRRAAAEAAGGGYAPLPSGGDDESPEEGRCASP